MAFQENHRKAEGREAIPNPSCPSAFLFHSHDSAPRAGVAVTLAVLLAIARVAHAAPADAGEPPGDAGTAFEAEPAPLPDAHVPRLQVRAEPTSGVMTGDVVRLAIHADALESDDVTVADQLFAPFEALASRARVEPAKDGRHTFAFEIDLLALEPGAHEIPAVELRVITGTGLVGAVRTAPIPLAVGSLVANEPSAELKPPTAPVTVLQDDYTLLWVLGAIGAAALIALITLLVSRWWRRRTARPAPPPPPRPPWEIAVEKLAALRREQRTMFDAGEGARFVDAVSDVVRAYLGGVFGFDGLETTTNEMNAMLAKREVPTGLRLEIGRYLDRCDLVKFAKMVPDYDEADLVLAKAQDIVEQGVPTLSDATPGAAPTGSAPAGSGPGSAQPPAGGPT